MPFHSFPQHFGHCPQRDVSSAEYSMVSDSTLLLKPAKVVMMNIGGLYVSKRLR